MNRLYRTLIAVGKTLFKFQGNQITLRGEENIPPSGGVLLVSNHIGFVDFIYIAYAVWQSQQRYTRFMVKKEAYSNPCVRWILRTLQHIPVDRSQGSAALEQTVRYLKQGEVVCIFAEGTFTPALELQEFKTGAARAAIEAQVPIIPVSVWGTHRILTAGHHHLGRARIPLMVSIGQPIVPQGQVEDITLRVHDQVYSLLSDQQASYPHEPDQWWVPQRLGGSAPTLAEVLEAKARKQAAKNVQDSTTEYKETGDQ